MAIRPFWLVITVFIMGVGTFGQKQTSASATSAKEKSVEGSHSGETTEMISQKMGVLDDIKIPSAMSVEGNDLFIVDENLVIRVYSIEPFAFRFTIGRKGDGPEEFKYPPHIWVYPDSVVASDFTKSLWFTRNGEFIKAVEYSDFPDFDTNQEMQFFPVGDRFIRNIVDHKSRKRTIILIDSKLRPLQTLYEGLFDWNQVGGGSEFNLLTHRIEVQAGDGEIFVSDTEKGFFLRVFDFNGNAVRTIDLNAVEKPIPVSAADKEMLLEEVRLTRQENVYQYAKANATVPDNFPRIHQIRFSDGQLYVTTHRGKKDLHEMLVLDRGGKVVDRLFLPIPSFHHFRGPFRSDFFTVSGGMLYELAQNPETGSWELFGSHLTE